MLRELTREAVGRRRRLLFEEKGLPLRGADDAVRFAARDRSRAHGHQALGRFEIILHGAGRQSRYIRTRRHACDPHVGCPRFRDGCGLSLQGADAEVAGADQSITANQRCGSDRLEPAKTCWLHARGRRGAGASRGDIVRVFKRPRQRRAAGARAERIAPGQCHQGKTLVQPDATARHAGLRQRVTTNPPMAPCGGDHLHTNQWSRARRRALAAYCEILLIA